MTDHVWNKHVLERGHKDMAPVPAATSSGNGGARSKEIRSDPNSVEDLSNSVSRLSVRHARSKSTNTGRWKSKY